MRASRYSNHHPVSGSWCQRMTRAVAWAVACLALATVGFADDDRMFDVQRGVLWEPFVEWSWTMPEDVARTFDVEATHAFSHVGSGALHTTRMFYAGGDTWSFRFTATRRSTWRFAIASPHEALNGWSGVVDVSRNRDPGAAGFLTKAGSRVTVPIDEGRRLAACTYHVYQNTPS